VWGGCKLSFFKWFCFFSSLHRCYVGQETIAKVHNLSAVKQQLWGLDLTRPAQPGAAVLSGAVLMHIKPFRTTGVCNSRREKNKKSADCFFGTSTSRVPIPCGQISTS
jgi:hypothetical protein